MSEKTENKVLLNKIYAAHWLKRYITFILGLIMVAVSYNLFIRKCNVIYGVGGLGIMIEKLFSVDPAITILISNVLLLILSYIFLGRDSTRNTIMGTILFPLLVKVTEPLLTIELGGLENILIVGCGAVLTGTGLGLVFKSGYTSGGTDILNQIISKYAKMSLGKAMYFSDMIIIIFCIPVFGLDIFIYSVLNMYVVGLITDKVIFGISSSKTFYIITEHETAVKKFITQNLSHGVTVIEGRGGYTGNVEKIIMCIVPTKEYYLFREGIKMIDKDAFFIVTDAYEASGGV